MKTFEILFFAILLVSISCGSVDKKSRLLYLHYENTTGEKGRTTFMYDENGVNYKARWELLDGSRYSFNYHTFDKRGNRIGKYREFSDSLTSNQEYGYDAEDNMISEHFSRSDGVKGNVKYKYDPYGRMVQAACKGLNGWFFGTIDYVYDDAGTKTGGRITRDSQTLGSIEYKYNEEKDLAAEVWKFGSGWSQTFTLEYENEPDSPPESFTSSNVFITNTENFRLMKENYDYNKENGGPSHFEYDSNGKLVKKVFERQDGLITETTFKYDDKGLLIESYRHHNDGRKTTFRYDFRKDRKLAVRRFERSDGVKGSENYIYSPEGRLVKAIYDNFDYWLNGIILFEYDEKGFISKGSFGGKDGYSADIEFDCDDNGNVIRIHWSFSFGATQTYNFEYDKTG